MHRYFKITELVLFFFFAFFSFVFSQEESITITTYYPSPYGSYNELRAKKMGIGDTYYQGTVSITDPADLIVEGNVGIGTTGPFGPLQVKTATNRNFLVFDYANTMTIQSVNDAGSALTAMRFRASPFVFTDGNVGIGTTSPQASQDGRTIKLDVSENIVAKDVYLDKPKTGDPRWVSEVGGFSECEIVNNRCEGGAREVLVGCSVSCPSDKWLISGGGKPSPYTCGSGPDGLVQSYPETAGKGGSWYIYGCGIDTGYAYPKYFYIDAYALCCK